MKIGKLRKQTETGYTFQIAFGPLWMRNWWYNADHDNVVPPSAYVAGKAYSHVVGHGIHFAKLRNIIKGMVAAGIGEYNSDDMMSVHERAAINTPGFEKEDEFEEVA